MHPDSAYEMLANFYAGDLIGPSSSELSKSAQFATEIRDLRDRLTQQGYFESSKIYYAYKVLSTLGLCGAGLGVLYKFGTTSTLAVLLSAILIGLFWQQCGWLAHDFAHHQCFESREYNDVAVVFLGILSQGFSLSW
jgi:fatty acid desaturase